MEKKIKKFNTIGILLNVLFLIVVFLFSVYGAVQVGEKIAALGKDAFLERYMIFVFVYALCYCVLTFIAIIWHELGHLYFGKKAGLEFISFNVLSFTFYKDGDKVKLKKERRIPGIKGYCNMTSKQDEKYDKKLIMLHYMGGVIFNLLMALVSLIILFISSNSYLVLILMLNIILNVYIALNNAIPNIAKSGTDSDALQVIYYLDDEEYLSTKSKLNTIQRQFFNGVALEDIDENLFSKPKEFKRYSDLWNALYYIDYIIAKEKLEEAVDYINKVLVEAKELLTKPTRVTLKLQLINCMFDMEDDVEVLASKIEKIWDDEIKKYLDVMSKVSPVFIGMNYLYSVVVEKNEVNAEKYLIQFHQINRNFYDKKSVEETEEMIVKIDEMAKIMVENNV